ncbi:MULTISPECIES: glycosyl hydrolase family 8 [unclassified Amycolatopsis]|uniref:glycosyl hydrolase family 8 n=1 Tax=unclassified Amycolatopsis TaxID=2618356 RepID=UPI002E11FA0B|nr:MULTISPECIES: glycosyl hydrolase family 8 [unclassified Amycolatopsis]WSJ76750.1 glycosyl hydrolase family 8 [Amycolatopsis sp. NBC_01307]WSK79673.1 glycosyl hydrolase family 8 [Amycolatopsis sp. NBC_01286]
MKKIVRAVVATAALAAGLLSVPTTASAAGTPYVPGTLRPSVSQATQDQVLQKYYDFWKKNFLTTKCGSGTYAVLSKDADHSFVAEGEGYGVTISAMMADKDPQARAIVDGIVKFVKAHPSVNNKDLHAAEQDANCKSVNGSDSATDGDLEIAYGLLIADTKWGSTGSVNYKAEAVRIINAIKKSEVNNSTKFTLLGDWGNDAEYKNSSRSSDWMPGHLRAFAKATGDSFWDSVRTRSETAVSQLQSQYAPNTGLLPDFVVNTNSTPKPAPADFLEGEYDGKYSWNACRDPWRLGADAISASGSAAAAQVRKMNTWIKSATGGDPSKIQSGYSLSGTKTESGQHPCFTAPFAVAAMTDPGSQAWLDKLWTSIAAFAPDSTDYYGTGITVQVLLILTGNYVAA